MIYEQEKCIIGLSEPEKNEFLDIFIVMSILNFMLTELSMKTFYTLRPCFFSDSVIEGSYFLPDFNHSGFM